MKEIVFWIFIVIGLIWGVGKVVDIKKSTEEYGHQLSIDAMNYQARQKFKVKTQDGKEMILRGGWQTKGSKEWTFIDHKYNNQVTLKEGTFTAEHIGDILNDPIKEVDDYDPQDKSVK